MVGYDDLYELLIYLNDDTPDLEESELEDFLFDRYEINIENFRELISDLLHLCSVGKSEITGIEYRGFGINNTWLVKEKIK